MDWFEKITGFRELPYERTQALLSVRDGRLHSRHSDRHWGVGTLETPTLKELRECVGALALSSQEGTRVTAVEGDARQLHADVVNCGALFQVASQFNLLEMTGPEATPEHGITRYLHDRTQGPACAIGLPRGPRQGTWQRRWLAVDHAQWVRALHP